MLVLLAMLFLARAQGLEVAPPTPHDRVVELQLTADDPVLIEGQGPTVAVEHEVTFEGTLHVWTRSELDLFVQVEDTNAWRTLGVDGDSGGGTTPYLALDVHAGDRLLVLVAAEPGAAGPLALHLMAAPETEATRAAAESGRRALQEAARFLAAGDRAGARARIHATVTELIATPGARQSEDISSALFEQAPFAFNELRDLDDSHAALNLARKHRERTLPADHPDLLRARRDLASTLSSQGDLAGARALQEVVLAARERTLPEDHPDLLRARQHLALTMRQQGDLAGARAIQEAVLAAYERTLPEDHPQLLRARTNLAVTMSEQGDLAGARALEEAVLAAYERTLPEDHPDLLLARGNLANRMREQGDLAGARALEEAVLATHERTLPEDHPDLLAARQSLALTMRQQGDLAGARAIQEAVLAAHERTLPEDHPDLLAARLNLAVTTKQQGDQAGARALEEGVLAARERTLPADHPDLLDARQNLANTMWQQGDQAGARALEEGVLAARERTLPADHPDLLDARHNLANTMREQGDLAGAHALQEAVLAARERTLPEDHPALLHARGNLAATLWQQGDQAGARALEEAVLAARERTLPADHPHLLHARGNLTGMMWEQGDPAGARALVPEQVAGISERVTRSLALAPRQAREAVGAEAPRLAQVLFLTRSADPKLQRSAFALQETMRLVVGEAARALRGAQDPEVRALLSEAAAVRAALGDLVMSSEEGREAEELTRLLQERDRLEREASRRLAQAGVVTEPIEVTRLAEVLAEQAALVAYRRIAHQEQDEESGKVSGGPDHLLAHVLASDGSLVRIDLGLAGELEELVAEWRRALGAPLLRGVASATDEGTPEDRERHAGEALRTRLFDPIVEVLGEETRRLFVCADDLVYLVPLDALPLGEGRVGDRWSLANEVSCARLQSPVAPLEVEAGLLALGGVDYEAEEDVETLVAADTSRGLQPGSFSRLLQTRFEAQTVGLLFEELLAVEPVVLTKEETTKHALFEHAPGKRYLHLATHGWFAPETIKSTLDTDASERGWTRTSLRERVIGMGPMLLCGLALAGANQPIDSLGRRPGILTAEELCSLDLSSCELAVLSACETNVGIRRAGQGIQSLQAALYAAGARSSITSLWKVDDAATRQLMELFYMNLWEEEMPKARALWEAKRVLRDEGAPVRDWAGWVLTGEAD